MAATSTNSNNVPLLRDFCEACLDLLNRGGRSGTVLDDMLPSFTATIRACGKPADRLEAELAKWESNAQRLTRLA